MEDGVGQEEIALNPNFRENEGALLRALLQATDYGVLLSGLDRQDILANQRMGELFTSDPDDIVRSDPDEVRKLALERVQSPEQFEQTLQRAYADPNFTLEDEVELAGEPPRILRRFTGPVRNRAGDPIARLWTFLDITETKQLQCEVAAQLAARTRDFEATRDLLQAMNGLCRLSTGARANSDPVVAIAAQVGELAGLRGAALFVRQYGASAGALCRSSEACRPLDLTEGLRRALDLLLAENPDAPERAARLDIRWAVQSMLESQETCLLPLRGEEGVFGCLVVGLCSGQHDPSGGVYRTEQLEALADQVAQTLEAHRLQTRLRETVESLKATQLRLVEIGKLHAAGTLAASIAHDIRNILSTLQLELELLPTDSEPVRHQLNRFSTLTHRLLAYARPGVLDLRPTSVPCVLDRLVPLLNAQAEIHGVTLVVNVPDTVSPVSADENQLEHLFVNLCLNAIQAMAERGGTLTTTVAQQEQWIITTVDDTGLGIPPEAMPRLFDAFFTTRANGFGLGLFSCKRIAEEHGGQICVENRAEGGARFTVSLPIPAPRAG